MTEDLKAEIERLKRALNVLYFGVDKQLQRLAENEYSNCASTQRDEQFELRKVLDK